MFPKAWSGGQSDGRRAHLLRLERSPSAYGQNGAPPDARNHVRAPRRGLSGAAPKRRDVQAKLRSFGDGGRAKNARLLSGDMRQHFVAQLRHDPGAQRAEGMDLNARLFMARLQKQTSGFRSNSEVGQGTSAKRP